MTIAIGSVLAERWELSSRLASGGMGDVYQAQDLRDGPDVAIKVLRSGILQGEERFAGEIQMLQRLDHPHVVAVVDAGEHEGVPYLVMELLPGRSLSNLVTDGALELDRARQIGAAIAAALAYAHGSGVINRDVKPGNILFADDGTAKLADFGIAKLMDASGITMTGQAMGTASYIAPEQLSAPELVGPPTDVYSLGLVLLEAATGVRAFVGTGTEAAMARLARDPQIPAELPDTWRRLLRAMTARDPAQRPPASEVAELLADGLPEESVGNLVVPVPAGDATVPMNPAAFTGDATHPTGTTGPATGTPPAAHDDATVAMGAGSPGNGTPATEADGQADETRVMGAAGAAGAAAAMAAGGAPSGSLADGSAAGASATDGSAAGGSAEVAPSPSPPRRGGSRWVAIALVLLLLGGAGVAVAMNVGADADDPPAVDTPEEPAPDDQPGDDQPADQDDGADDDGADEQGDPEEEPEEPPDPDDSQDDGEEAPQDPDGDEDPQDPGDGDDPPVEPPVELPQADVEL